MEQKSFQLEFDMSKHATQQRQERKLIPGKSTVKECSFETTSVISELIPKLIKCYEKSTIKRIALNCGMPRASNNHAGMLVNSADLFRWFDAPRFADIVDLNLDNCCLDLCVLQKIKHLFPRLKSLTVFVPGLMVSEENMRILIAGSTPLKTMQRPQIRATEKNMEIAQLAGLITSWLPSLEVLRLTDEND
ncbi:unnamed protein product [Soboliphyme baturini]|uniref:Uncharacterized protein n=1 Tax=Soboliphyme baturini TaxID=241478 RepID=A0A183ISS7_9BILA|nr:unnamed protein product [Soboliphyme baturini]